MIDMTNDEMIEAIVRSLDENAKRFRYRMKVRKLNRGFTPSPSPSKPRCLTEQQLVDVITKSLKETSKRVAEQNKRRRKLSVTLLRHRPDNP